MSEKNSNKNALVNLSKTAEKKDTFNIPVDKAIKFDSIFIYRKIFRIFSDCVFFSIKHFQLNAIIHR